MQRFFEAVGRRFRTREKAMNQPPVETLPFAVRVQLEAAFAGLFCDNLIDHAFLNPLIPEVDFEQQALLAVTELQRFFPHKTYNVAEIATIMRSRHMDSRILHVNFAERIEKMFQIADQLGLVLE